MKINKKQADDLRKSILNDNKILYCMKDRPCTETTMCWGLECGDGWLEPIDKMSKALEALNCIFYPKFRVRVQMDQLKEKFGTLHVYYSIIVDPPKWMCAWHSIFQKIFDRIDKLDFKMLQVLDHDAYDEVVETELKTKDEYEREKKSYANCCNVEVFEKDGKFFKKATYEHCRKTHHVPTKHKLLYWLSKRSYWIEDFPVRLFSNEPSHVQRCIEELLEDKVQAIVSKAEKECYEVCEYCGQHISDTSTVFPRCTTYSYIQHLCKDCADETKNEYVMNGAVYKEGKEVLSKEAYAKEKAEIEDKFKKFEEGDDDED